MAVVQSTHSATLAKAYAGCVANGETSNIISRIVETSAGIAYGKAVFRGTADRGVVSTPSAGLIGITVANYAAPAVEATGVQDDIYPQNSTAGVMTSGVIWVTVGSDVTDGAQVYVGDGDPLTAGAFSSSSTGNVILTGWFFEDTVSSGALARIAKR